MITTAIITRPKHGIKQTQSVYEAAGLAVFPAPCFALESNQQVAPQWLQSPADVWVILSVPALQHARLIAPAWQPPPSARIVAVGPAVERAWQASFEHPVKSHPWMNSEGVIELLKTYEPKSINILTTGSGRDLIKSYCLSARISYTQINTYRRLALDIDVVRVGNLYNIASTHRPILTATSQGVLDHFMAQLSPELKQQVLSAPLVVAAPRIATVAEGHGFVDVHCADNPSDVAMCECVVNLVEA